jgi:hypothetical protein
VSIPKSEIARRADLMATLPLIDRLAAINSADNVIDGRFRFAPPRVVRSEEDCA